MQAEENATSAINVFQGTGSIIDGNLGYGNLATFAAGPCCIVAAHCPETKKLFLTHIDNSSYINDVCNKIKYFIRDNQTQNVNIHLLSAQQEWTELQNKIKEQIQNHTIIQASLNTGKQGGEDFTIDTNGNYTNTVDMKNLQNIDSFTVASMATIFNTYEGINNKNLELNLVVNEKIPLKTREKLFKPQSRLGSVETERRTTSALTPPPSGDTNNSHSKSTAHEPGPNKAI